jgi:glycosyltransferase involved in cell wall biosynthesis
MSVYNSDKYLDESIQSVLGQSYSNFEFILVNDGSSDSSVSIINRYASKDSRIKVISRENRGLIVSLNEAIGVASGKYVARMDADDISERTRFSKQLAVMEADAEIVVCGTSFVEFGTNVRPKTYVLDSHRFQPYVELMFGPPVVHPSTMLRTAVLKRFPQPYLRAFIHAEDYELWTRLIKLGKIINLAEPLVQLRYRDDSVTRVADLDPFGARFEIISSIQQAYLSSYGIRCDETQRKLHYLLSDHRKAALYPGLSINDMREYAQWLLEKLTYLHDVNLQYAREEVMRRYGKLIVSLSRSKRIGLFEILGDKLFYRALHAYSFARLNPSVAA